jgi:enamine deaminase RidA (YjgF/YER057c/UK114 family)
MRNAGGFKLLHGGLAEGALRAEYSQWQSAILCAESSARRRFITSQTVGLIKDIQKLLESQKLTLSDVVMMHVFLGADPAKDGKIDFAGMTAGYTQFFSTKDQPDKPARTTLQVVLPAASSGALIEIDLVAVRPK